jgi:hypothetical protein
MERRKTSSYSSASTGRIAVKFDMRGFCENLTKSSKFGYNRAKLLNTAQETLSSFYSCFWH